jgi:hypothetical protein
LKTAARLDYASFEPSPVTAGSRKGDCAMSNPKIILGRDGVGEAATEDDFMNWVGYVCDRIDDATGLSVDVEIAQRRDVQEDRYEGDDDERESMRDAVRALWDSWCEIAQVAP